MPGLIPITVQMITAMAAGGKQPVIITEKESDNTKLKAIKCLINKLIVKDAHKRPSAQDVVDALKSIVGMLALTTRYHAPHIWERDCIHTFEFITFLHSISDVRTINFRLCNVLRFMYCTHLCSNRTQCLYVFLE